MITLFEKFSDPTRTLVDYVYDLCHKKATINYYSPKINVVKIKKLINDGANIDSHDDKNTYGSILCMIVDLNNLPLVKFLIKKGAKLDERNSIGSTPLYYAAAEGYYDIVKCLIENGADINIPNDSRITPLMASAYKSYWDIATLLLNKGAEINGFFGMNYKKDYNFQKLLIQLYPTEFIDNTPPQNIHEGIKKEFPYLFAGINYNL